MDRPVGCFYLGKNKVSYSILWKMCKCMRFKIFYVKIFYTAFVFKNEIAVKVGDFWKKDGTTLLAVGVLPSCPEGGNSPRAGPEHN